MPVRFRPCERFRQLEQGHGTGPIIISAIVDLLPILADVVVVRGDHDQFFLPVRALHIAEDILALQLLPHRLVHQFHGAGKALRPLFR